MTEMDPGQRPALSRKRFIDWLLGTSAGGFVAAVFYPVVRYIIPPEVPESSVNSVTLAFTANDVPSNTGRIFKFGSRPGLLVKTPSGELRAYSARCTHLDCTVQYRDDWNLIWCACHNGRYDLTGRNVSGPPPRPLEVFQVEVRGEEIHVHRA